MTNYHERTTLQKFALTQTASAARAAVVHRSAASRSMAVSGWTKWVTSAMCTPTLAFFRWGAPLTKDSQKLGQVKLGVVYFRISDLSLIFTVKHSETKKTTVTKKGVTNGDKWLKQRTSYRSVMSDDMILTGCLFQPFSKTPWI